MRLKQIFLVVILSFFMSFCYADTVDESENIPSPDEQTNLNKHNILINFVNNHRAEFPDYEGSDYDIIDLLKNNLIIELVEGKIRAYRRNFPDSDLSDQEIYDLFDSSKNQGVVPELEYIEEDNQKLTFETFTLIQLSDDDVLEATGDRKGFVKRQIAFYKQQFPSFVATDYDILDYFKGMILGKDAEDYSMIYHNGYNETEINLKVMLDAIYEDETDHEISKMYEAILQMTYNELLAEGSSQEGYNKKMERITRFGFEAEMKRVMTEIDINEKLQIEFPGANYLKVNHEGEEKGGVKNLVFDVGDEL